MFSATATGYVSKKGVTHKEVGQQMVYEFQLLCNHNSGKCTSLVSCSVWGKRGSIIEQYVKPGDQFTVVGEIGNIRIMPANDEQSKELYVVNFNVKDFELPKRMGGTSSARPPVASAPTRAEKYDNIDEEVPF
jgi:single-stranded DNA-binding protein